ncbi:hypothetical protein Tco_0931894, partial [Tanacetum coccineum]
MTAPFIPISSDVSVKSVGSSFPIVILFGSIPVEVPVAPDVGAAAVALPAGVLELDTHSLPEVNPSKSSPPPVSVAPMVLPFLCSNDSESNTEIPERHVSPTSHDAMITIWRSRFTSRLSSPTTSTPEIPTTPILPTPSAIVALSSEALTARKSVRPLPSHRLALRYTSHHLDHFTSKSSSSYSSSDHSLSRHTPPNTTDADSSTLQRFVHRSLARTPRCSEACLCWRSTSLSVMYPPTTSESSAGDSSFELSAGPSCKRCRSPAAIVTLSIHATRALVPSRADLLPPCKIFRDSSSPEYSVEEDIDTDVLEDIEVDATAVEDEVEDEVESSDRCTIEVEVDLAAGIDILDAMLLPDAVERLEQVEEELESRSLIAGGERASLLEQVAYLERINVNLRGTMMMERARADRRLETFANMTITRSAMTPKAIEELVSRIVEEALDAYEVTRAANALEAENQSQNGSDDDNGNGGNGNGGNGNGENGNGENGKGGNGNPNKNGR